MKNYILSTGILLFSFSFIIPIFGFTEIAMIILYISMAVISSTLIVLYNDKFLIHGILILIILFTGPAITILQSMIIFVLYYVLFYFTFIYFLYGLRKYIMSKKIKVSFSLSFYGLVLQFIDVSIYPYLGLKLFDNFENYTQYSGQFITPAGFLFTISLPSILILISNIMIFSGFVLITLNILKREKS